MDFGIFDHVDRNASSLPEQYEQRMRLVELYDQLGFYGYHIAEHHSTPLGMAPSPSVYLASVIQRTRRLRIGPLVYLLPLYNPLRLLEEICMLDNLSGGRMQVGVGRGVRVGRLRRASSLRLCRLNAGGRGAEPVEQALENGGGVALGGRGDLRAVRRNDRAGDEADGKRGH